MRICLLGEKRATPDEGMAKIATELDKRLSRSHRVLTLSPLQATRFGFWHRIREFAPDVIHYIPGPSLKSFLLIKLLSITVPEAKTIISAPLPQLPSFSHSFLRMLKPDLVLAQSHKMLRSFLRWGLQARYFPLSGVDLKVFKPVANRTKEELRRNYGISLGDFVALHVGHLNSQRNVIGLRYLQEAGVQTHIVGSASTRISTSLRKELTAAGCKVISEFNERVYEVYQLADCYVFPTPVENGSASIEIPLSVLEAAASNLPIVSTRFGGLPQIFENVPGFVFIDSEGQLMDGVREIASGKHKVDTRNQASCFSWSKNGDELEILYGGLLNGAIPGNSLGEPVRPNKPSVETGRSSVSSRLPKSN